MKKAILGKQYDTDDAKCMDSLCDAIDAAKARGAYGDLSAIAYGIVIMLETTLLQRKQDGNS